MFCVMILIDLDIYICNCQKTLMILVMFCYNYSVTYLEYGIMDALKINIQIDVKMFTQSHTLW